MFPRRNKKLTAWLGLVSIWLIVSMPIASQWLSHAADGVDAALCHAHDVRAPHTDPASAYVGVHLDACGYCGLLAHSPAFVAPVVAVPLRHVQSERALPGVDCEPRLASPHLACYPRAPPRAV